MLTADEAHLAEQAFYQGPAVLLDSGLSEDEVREFIAREDVQLRFLLLKREYDIHEGLKARAKFKFVRNLHRLIDGASAVIANGLAGPQYARDKDGNILRDGKGRPVLQHTEPTRTQLRSAKLVMDGVGVADWRLRGDSATDPSTKLLFHATEGEVVTIEHDPAHESEEDKALSRERVRNAIEALIPRLTEARGRVKDEIGIDPATESTAAKRKKRTTKKAATKKKRTSKKTTKRKTTRRRGSSD